MPLRIPCPRVLLTSGTVLSGYWGPSGLPRPLLDVYVVGPSRRPVLAKAQIDTAADYTLVASGAAAILGLTLPFPRRALVSGLGGSQTVTASFPPDGLVSLFVTDYREYAYLPRPLVGFHAPGRAASAQRSVLGLTGFLQHFIFLLDLPATPPTFELYPKASFPGSLGVLPRDRSLPDFIASLGENA